MFYLQTYKTANHYFTNLIYFTKTLANIHEQTIISHLTGLPVEEKSQFI